MSVLVGVLRVVTDAGFMLYAGPLVVWAWLAARPATVDDPAADPAGYRPLRVGLVLLGLSSVASPFLVPDPGAGTSPFAGPAATLALVQLAVVVGTGFFAADLVRARDTTAGRIALLLLPVVVAVTLSAQSPVVGGRLVALELVGTVVHVLAAGVWLGPLVVLLVLLVSRTSMDRVEPWLARLVGLRLVCVVALVLSGVVITFATAGAAALTTAYGLALLIKIVLFAAVVVVAEYGRTHVARIAFREAYLSVVPVGSAGVAVAEPIDEPATSAGGARALIMVLRIELVLAVAVLALTGIVVAITPR